MKIVLSILSLACNAIIVEKGQSAILVCIDGDKQREIEPEASGKSIELELLKTSRINGEDKEEAVFVFELNEAGNVDGATVWTNENVYTNGKFDTIQDQSMIGIKLTKANIGEI